MLSRQETALILVTMFWGTTFLIIHTAMRHSGPLFFVGFRFLCAGIVTSIIFYRSLRGITLIDFMAGLTIGFFLFLGYGLQTAGLEIMSSSQSAFISALYVPIVPLVQWVFFRKAPSLFSWVGIFLAFIGLIFVTNITSSHVKFSLSELQTLLGAIAIAIEIVLIGFFSHRVDSLRVTIVQLYAASLFSFTAMVIWGEAIPQFSWVWFFGGLGLGVMSGAIQLTMNWAQKSISPTRATIIYACEPVWAGIVGRIAGDQLPPYALLGIMFILAGILVAEVRTPHAIKAKSFSR